MCSPASTWEYLDKQETLHRADRSPSRSMPSFCKGVFRQWATSPACKLRKRCKNILVDFQEILAEGNLLARRPRWSPWSRTSLKWGRLYRRGRKRSGQKESKRIPIYILYSLFFTIYFYLYPDYIFYFTFHTLYLYSIFYIYIHILYHLICILHSRSISIYFYLHLYYIFYFIFHTMYL